ncbi:Rossmann-fold NAD(P)-binding domain-containing protein [Henriciella mobilis]|uniref:NAD(P)-dependent oxidoreductase n=1 Tax=Henriciella mobilis TaxID=2305467 RepID=A0A399RPS2_9PROT|nr:hypothetical protein [Henriciella mobilis]RIJ32323.1 hypothetical protein D1223_00190 [Henriciella mobilis]
MQGLVGFTGFVGGNLTRQRHYDACFNSSTIADIAGQSFDQLVCAGAPATMWLANKDPDADLRNLTALADHLASAKIKRLVLISSIAVLADVSAAQDETTGLFEQDLAYGRNRRAFEEAARKACEKLHIIRLPALFGEGLKKNFIYDLINPLPSFLKDEAMAAIRQAVDEAAMAPFSRHYTFADAVGMWQLDRKAVAASGDEAGMRKVIEDLGMSAKFFTNSQSRFQYYNVGRLADDIDTVTDADLDVTHLTAEPLMAADIHAELIGGTFENDRPARVNENVHTVHGPAFGRTNPYLFSKDETLSQLRKFYESNVPV